MKKRIAAAGLCAALLFLPAACSTSLSKDPVTAEAFVSTMENSSYTVEEATDAGADNTAYVAVKGDITLMFATFDSVDDATAFYNITQPTIEARKGTSSSNSSVNVASYSMYSLTTGESFYYICRVDSTALVAEAPKDDKGDLQAIIKELGY